MRGDETHYVVYSSEHGRRLFPGAKREPLHTTIREMTAGGKACLITLSPGSYEARPLVNGGAIAELCGKEDEPR